MLKQIKAAVYETMKYPVIKVRDCYDEQSLWMMPTIA